MKVNKKFICYFVILLFPVTSLCDGINFGVARSGEWSVTFNNTHPEIKNTMSAMRNGAPSGCTAFVVFNNTQEPIQVSLGEDKGKAIRLNVKPGKTSGGCPPAEVLIRSSFNNWIFYGKESGIKKYAMGAKKKASSLSEFGIYIGN